MAGGGIKGGQVVGKTDKEGAEVVERKTSALDFLATVRQLLRIDYNKQNSTPIGFGPSGIVDNGSNPDQGTDRLNPRGRVSDPDPER